MSDLLVLAYPPASLRADFARAVAGLGLTLGPMPFLAGLPEKLVLGALTALFIWFLARTLAKRRARYVLEEDALSAGGRRLAWTALRGMRLRAWPSSRREREGWTELELHFAGARLHLDSRLDGFLPLCRRAAAEAGRLRLDTRSRAALAKLGIGISPRG
jgi:hypothetical protein